MSIPGAGGLLAQAPAGTAPAPLAADLVKEFIVKAHQRKIEPVKDLLGRSPHLIHASWDWGGGDFENALQGAAHTGSREMALFLLAQGARLDLYAAAMLGEVTILEAAALIPGALASRGAHKIPLLSHAVAGAEPAQRALEFLLTSGAELDARDKNGVTALMLAAQSGQADTVRRLLQRGADPMLKAADGNTALGLSLKRNHQQVAQTLRKAGATD
jgi:ankyrin repeat protein